MQNPLQKLIKDRDDYFRYLLLALAVLLVTWMIPKRGKFQYEFELGKTWMHNDLVAPFQFAIRKSETALQKERQDIKDNFKPFYKKDPSVSASMKERFVKLVKAQSDVDTTVQVRKKYYLTKGLNILNEIYDRGLINVDSSIQGKPDEFILTEVKNNFAEDKLLGSYNTLPEVRSFIMDTLPKNELDNKSWFISALNSCLAFDVTYDKDLSEKKLNELLNTVATSRGMVKQGQKIISKGNIVSPDRYQMLNSLKMEYEAKLGKSYLIFIGYFVLVAALFIMYAFNLEIFHEEILARTRSTVLILINVILFTGLTAYIVHQEAISIYLIPYSIVPIVLLAFFGVRIAVLTHFLVILLCGLIVPNPYEFVLMQTLAGFTGILSMVRIRYISQFFISALLIFMTYCLVYLGINFTKNSMIQEVDWSSFSWLGGNFILTLLAYPLIYANEKIFGFLSDISLLELADINNKLLKELFLRAPGTFQHSLQVANLAEAVIDRVGGNALLTRVGALYHDIGKLYNPDYFIENQKFSFNPHEQLTDIQSADVIIRHVTKGVEIAQEYHLPKKVIDFIRSHHGTTRVEYFYKHYLQEHVDNEVDENIFRYPGPKPASKEMAVVMIVDSVEAASRSLKQPDEKQIDQLVDKIIDAKIQDNQFDYATITIHEINTARRILKKLVKSIYHIRIQYPAETEEKKSF
jgi:putative nucleotidyltransferase with HDIG domain